MITAPPDSEADFYGALVRASAVGPRREVALRIETWRKGKVFFTGGGMVTLRLGAIENYEEVRAFFRETPADSLHYLREVSKPRARLRVIEMEFDRSGKRLRIVAGKASLIPDAS